MICAVTNHWSRDIPAKKLHLEGNMQSGYRPDDDPLEAQIARRRDDRRQVRNVARQHPPAGKARLPGRRRRRERTDRELDRRRRRGREPRIVRGPTQTRPPDLNPCVWSGLCLRSCARKAYLRRPLPRRSRAASRLHSPRRSRDGAATLRPRRCDSSPRNICVAAAAPPRLVSTECPRRSREAAATRPRNIRAARARLAERARAPLARLVPVAALVVPSRVQSLFPESAESDLVDSLAEVRAAPPDDGVDKPTLIRRRRAFFRPSAHGERRWTIQLVAAASRRPPRGGRRRTI